MKNSLWITMLAFALTACKQEPQYALTGEFPGMPDGVKVYLHLAHTPEPLDSTLTADGRFQFKGKLEAPAYCTLRFREEGNEKTKNKLQDFWLENATIRLACPWDSLRYNNAAVTGSASQDLHTALEKKLRLLYRQNNAFFREEMEQHGMYAYEGIFKPEYTAAGMAAAAKQREIGKQVIQLRQDFIRNNPGSVVALKVFRDMLGSKSKFTPEEVNALVNVLDPGIKTGKAYSDLEKQLDVYLRTAKGQPFMDFDVVDANGKRGRFSDYLQAGKYNLLECWASWCGPCRGEIPHLKHVHAVCGQDFNIIAVSVDTKEEEWTKALDEEQPAYTQLRNLPDCEGKRAHDYYGFTGIPYTLLLDGEGRVVDAELRGASLDLVLTELLGEKAKGL